MTQGERVREIRKSLNLTLEKFGEKLGVGKTAISNIEVGNRNLTDQMLRSICREYSVSEEWLKNGTGEMFVSLTRREKIASFLGELMKEEDESYRVRFVEALADLDVEQWEMLEKLAISFTKKD
ncbi:MAG: helix-turn-helix transcriptional regulator [Lachnospiraceae bacterium]|nr:helix-turn-helix transcriptional regulator [Lachnospiraceae bacterium]